MNHYQLFSDVKPSKNEGNFLYKACSAGSCVIQNIHSVMLNFSISGIQIYQSMVSPLNEVLGGCYFHCRFFPSCSAYAQESLRQYGLLKGSMASARRIMRCNPWNKGGYDPV